MLVLAALTVLILQSEICPLYSVSVFRSGEMAERLKVHAWKACVRDERTAGSNPALSARILDKLLFTM